MEPKIIKEFLLSKGIEHLYHANSVVTALTYINNGGLMSRSFVENAGLLQTPQKTDKSDKILGVYGDIFFDSVDLHLRMNDINYYGSVLFVYSVELLDDISSYDVLITKSNPIHWDEAISNNEKYFSSLYELKATFQKGNFNQHITIRHINEPISFNRLSEIILDYPGDDKKAYFDTAKNEIESALKKNNIHIPIKSRVCHENCKCRDKYKNYKEGFTYHRFKTTP